jgi:hypothetical protein
MAKKKSAAPVRYVVKYEFDGSPHYGAIQINDRDRLNLETPHGSKAATLNPKSDVWDGGGGMNTVIKMSIPIPLPRGRNLVTLEDARHLHHEASDQHRRGICVVFF